MVLWLDAITLKTIMVNVIVLWYGVVVKYET